MDPKELARLALQLIDSSTVRCDSASINAAHGVRTMLDGIACGKYVVTQPQEASNENPTPDKVKRK